MMRATLPPLAAAVLLAGCSSGPSFAEGTEPQGERMPVRLLSSGFVEASGRTMAIEEFIYELRVACREVGEGAPPWIEVTAPSNEEQGMVDMVQTIRDGAYAAGVTHVELLLEGS